MTWHTKPEDAAEVAELEKKAIATATRNFTAEEVETYQNFTREGPLQMRFGTEERIEKLKALKKQWDPKGIFTDVFL